MAVGRPDGVVQRDGERYTRRRGQVLGTEATAVIQVEGRWRDRRRGGRVRGERHGVVEVDLDRAGPVGGGYRIARGTGGTGCLEGVVVLDVGDLAADRDLAAGRGRAAEGGAGRGR